MVMLPLDIIIDFEKRSVSAFEFDWEMVLEKGYRQFLTKDSFVLDIGGHVGRHSEVFVKQIHCKQVVIFEPLSAQRSLLERHFCDYDAVRIFPYALSNYNGKSEFVVNLAAPEESGLQERIYNDPEAKSLKLIPVQVRCLDDLTTGLQRIDYMKIDAEGAEIDIIKGAKKTLHKHKPILSIEYGMSSYTAYGYTRTSLFEVINEIEYTLCDLFGNPFDAEQWDNVVDRFYWDYYAVPNEKVSEFQSCLWNIVYQDLDNCRFSKTL